MRSLAYNSGKERHTMKTIAIELPEEVATLLQAEVKRSKKSMAEYVMQWLEDQADIREANAMMERIKSGKEKTTPWSEARKRLVDAP
jgi:predicted DNA-binding protein